MDQKVVDLSGSFSLTTYLPIYLSVYPSIYLSIYSSIHLSIYPSTYLPIYPSNYLSIYRSFYLSINRSIYLSISLSVCLSACLSIYLSICKLENLAILRDFFIFPSWLTTSKTQHFCETSSFFEVDHIKNEAILRDLRIFWSWPHQERSNSARLLQFLNLTLTTSKTKQFCETSSIFELDNIKNEAILRDVLQKWKVDCRADGLVPMRFAIFPVHLSKLLRLPRKSDARSCEVLCLSREIISANLKIWCSKMQPLSGNQRPDLRTAPMKMSCSAPATENASLQILFKCPTPAIVFGNATKPSRFAHFWEGAQSLAPATRNELWTSKTGPYVVCFVHFDFEMCFAPQRHALFRHRNF